MQVETKLSNLSEPGGFWLRVAAYWLDDTFLTIACFIVVIVAAIFTSLGQVKNFIDGQQNSHIIGVTYLAFILFYKSAFESSKFQATPGKIIVGLKIVNSDGASISVLRALLRNLAKILSYMIFGIGFLMSALPARKRCLHDILTGCYVVKQHKVA